MLKIKYGKSLYDIFLKTSAFMYTTVFCFQNNTEPGTAGSCDTSVVVYDSDDNISTGKMNKFVIIDTVMYKHAGLVRKGSHLMPRYTGLLRCSSIGTCSVEVRKQAQMVCVKGHVTLVNAMVNYMLFYVICAINM